jgi:PAS domain S-box-containing protein
MERDAKPNIPEHRRSERPRLPSDVLGSVFFQAAPFAMALTDPIDSTIVSVNEAFLRVFGFTREDIIGKTSVELGITDVDARARVAAELAQRGVVRSFECTRVTRTGERRSLVLDVDRVEIGDRSLLWTTVQDVTERKLNTERIAAERRDSQRTLDASEARYLASVAHAAVGVALVETATGRYVQVNAKAVEISGYTEEEFLTLTWESLTHPDDLEMSREGVRRMQLTREPYRCEKRYLRKDGSIVWASVTVSPVLVPGQPLTTQVVVIEDITERRMAAQVLLDSEARYRSLVENSLEGIGYSKGNRILFANQAFLAMLGYDSLEECAAIPLLEHVAPESRAFIEDRLRRRALGEPLSHTYEYKIRRKDGGVRDVEICTITVEISGEGYVQSTFRDITERKRAEEALRESERKYRYIADNTGDVIWLLDLGASRFRYVSPAVLRLRGYTPEEVMAEDMESSLTPESLELVRSVGAERMARYLEGERKAYVDQIAQPCKDGSVVWTETVTRYESDGGRIVVYGVSRDITERKRLQAQIARADRLATMGTMAAGVGHEINNPLTYVLCNVEALANELKERAVAVERLYAALDERLGAEELAKLAGSDAAALPEALRQAAARAQEAFDGALRMKSVTQSLSTFARTEVAEPSAIDVRGPIETAIKLASNEIKHRARLVTDFGAVPAVRAIDGPLAQVFLNLILNAVHAVDERHEGANILTVKTWSEGPSVFVEVRDSGCGIAPESLPHIFDPFFTTKAIGKGSGLGLAICRNIIHELGGEIRVESELGVGSSFIVRLPASAAAAPSAPAVSVAVRPRPETKRGRVLVIDDEAAILKTMERVLARTHDVVAASSGGGAKAALEVDSAFDAIVCDLMMPGMTGMELHAWLVARRPELASRVVFVTGGAFTPAAEEFLARITNPRIDKPFDHRQLASVVNAVVAATKGTTDAQ